MAKKTGTSRKKVVKIEPVGQAHIHASFNNIIISLTNNQGQVISWASAGKMGFKGSKKNTPYAAQMAAANCSKTAYDLVNIAKEEDKLLAVGHIFRFNNALNEIKKLIEKKFFGDIFYLRLQWTEHIYPDKPIDIIFDIMPPPYGAGKL